LNKHKPCFDEGCSELLDQRNQAKLQWLQDPSEINGDNLKNVRCQASRHFWNKKKEYMKNKIDELVTNSKKKNIRDLYREINEFNKGYQRRSNIVKMRMVICLQVPTKKTKLRGRSPQANYTDRRPLLVGEVSANLCG
jgi:hypothetical protein